MSKKTFTSFSMKEKEKKIQDYVLSLEKKIKEEFRNLIINEGEIIVLKANDI